LSAGAACESLYILRKSKRLTTEDLMMKLIRLAVYALIGYAAYYFVTDVLNRTPEMQPARSGGGKGRGGRRTGGGGGRARAGGTARITGRSKAGKVEETLDNDGGAVRHRVGRGVVES
jgi:hypothetical protein